MAMFAAAGLLLLAGAGLARHQLNYWQNDGTLFRHALAVTKSNAVAHLNLGVYLGNNGELDEAIRNFRETLDIETNGLNAMTAHYNLGYLMNCAGQPAEAEKEYREAIRIDPDYYPAHYNLGISLNQLGRREEAIEQFLIALRLKPDMPDPRQQLQALGVEPH
jgi:tetratricopeptide (TPR) repeat protein